MKMTQLNIHIINKIKNKDLKSNMLYVNNTAIRGHNPKLNTLFRNKNAIYCH